MTDETRMILNEIGTLKSSINGIESRFNDMESRFNDMESRFNSMESRFNGMESRFNGMESNIKDIQVSLENETNRNIRLIAEGHLDLTRKLDEVLKVKAEQEMLPIRMNTLENEVRRLKERVEAIA